MDLPTSDRAEYFKQCPHCAEVWPDRPALLEDPDVELVGYQSWLPDSVVGMFLLNHIACGTTLAIDANEFTDLHDGPVYAERLAFTDSCSGLCQDWSQLDACPQKCECAFVREVLQIVRNWPKQRKPSA